MPKGVKAYSPLILCRSDKRRLIFAVFTFTVGYICHSLHLPPVTFAAFTFAIRYICRYYICRFSQNPSMTSANLTFAFLTCSNCYKCLISFAIQDFIKCQMANVTVGKCIAAKITMANDLEVILLGRQLNQMQNEANGKCKSGNYYRRQM